MAFPQVINVVLVAAASILVLYWLVSRGKKLEAQQKIDRDVAKPQDRVQAIEGTPVTLDALQGEWRVLELGKRARFAPVEELALADLRMQVSGDRMTMLRSGETDKLRLNAATFPTELDQVGADGKTTLCIARMVDGQLELCQADPGKERPTKFSRDRSNKNTVVRFVRVSEPLGVRG